MSIATRATDPRTSAGTPRAERITLPRLFLLAYSRGFPHGVARDVLRALAQSQFGIQLERCTDRQLEWLAATIEDHTYTARPAKPTADEQPCTEAQRDRVRTLASMLGWSAGTLSRFLQQHCGVGRVIELRSRNLANRAIDLLEAFHREKARSRSCCRHGEARRGEARPGQARLGEARRGHQWCMLMEGGNKQAGLGLAWRGRAWRGLAGRGKARAPMAHD